LRANRRQIMNGWSGRHRCVCGGWGSRGALYVDVLSETVFVDVCGGGFVGGKGLPLLVWVEEGWQGVKPEVQTQERPADMCVPQLSAQREKEAADKLERQQVTGCGLRVEGGGLRVWS